MADDIQITEASGADVEAIMRLLEMQFVEHRIEVASPELMAGLVGMLRDRGLGVILTARQGEQIVGVAVLALAWTLEHGGKSAWLDELYVSPGLGGQGIGQALVAAAMEKAGELGCSAVDLEVDQDHSRAESLYQRLGFVRLPRSRWVKRLVNHPRR